MKQPLQTGRNILMGVMIAFLCFSCDDDKMFQSLSPRSSGIDFANTIEETEDFNILEYLYMYNGGGVAIGDINNDGLPDIYFTANQKPNRLYLNKGNLKFEDITEKAGILEGNKKLGWTTGTTMVDINADGWLDIYVCQFHGYKNRQGGNQLYINNQDGTFTEKAEKYGLDVKSYAQQAAFFDYDLDGDLDMYLLNQAVHTPNAYKDGTLRTKRDSLSGDRLYKNVNGKFTDASEQAGIYGGTMSYGLALNIADLNNDGYPDIYVANDFHENDYLYYNQGDGTFKENIMESMGHTSTFSMGNDVADINNDGWLDVVTLDMRPDDEKVLKRLLGAEEYSIYQFKINHSYHFQYARNMLQLNQGKLFDTTTVQFSEIGEYSGISATDWSWGALFADFDLDGNKDLFISNGIPHRPNDLDFINYTSNEKEKEDNMDFKSLIASIPSGKVANVAFRNNENKFEDISEQWGLDYNGYSNGAAYADLDNDGDLDLVLNNLNAKATIYENTISAKREENNFIKIKLEGPKGNSFGLGARVIIKSSKLTQMQELFPVKGWLSAMDHTLLFGLGDHKKINKLKIRWNDGKEQILENIAPNQTLILKYSDAQKNKSINNVAKITKLFQNIDQESGIDFQHKENNFVDFEYEKLMPRMLSSEGPKIAVGDVDNDGLDDFYIGGAKNQAGALYVQREDGEKLFSKLDSEVFFKDRANEDVGTAFLDVDLDGDLDLYVVSGGGEPFQDFTLADRLYLNDGKGNFKKSMTHPQLSFNGSCAVKADFNEDGITDLFIGARSIPGSYGKYVRSRILLGNGKGELYDVTARVFGENINLGMVTDAVWLRESRELVIVGEWMPVTVLNFNSTPLTEKKIPNTSGWWNTVHAADMDNDGDQDLLLGNMGTNTNLRPSLDHPVNLYLKDFDNNASLDPILSYYKNGTEYPYFGLDELSKQLVAIKKVYRSYEAYANSSFSEVFPPEELNGAGRLQAFTFESAYLENQGYGDFKIDPLPTALQMAPLYSFLTADFDKDGTIDVLSAGNFYGNQINMGKSDASYGHFLKRNGQENTWNVMEPRNSGFAIAGEVRDIKLLNGSKGKQIILVSKNNEKVQAFSIPIKGKNIN